MPKKFLSVLILISFSSAQSRREWDHPMRQAVRGTHGAIAAGSEYATEAGMRIYYRGGNAVDAGVTAMFSASVTELSHFGMGGEAPILIRTKTGKVYSIAGVGTMPKLATGEMFRNRPLRAGEILETDPGGLKGIIPVAGIMPALVPGMVDAGLLALREFGTKSFNEVIAPAIELADGFAIDEMRARASPPAAVSSICGRAPRLISWPTARFRGSARFFASRISRKTLRGMAEAEKKALSEGKSRQAAIDAVRDYFYRGEVAHKIDAFMKANGGLLRYEDMAAFKLELEEPVSTTYRGYKVYKPGFWSQGPAMIETLNIMEGFDSRAPLNSAEYIHRLAEALKLAYADRDTYYGDPKFSTIPTEVLLSKEYGNERRRQITEKASQDFLPGKINGKIGKHPSRESEAPI